MDPDEVQSVTMPYGWRTLSTAVSGIPECNGIPRLDEVMSGIVRVDTYRMIRLLHSYKVTGKNIL